MGPSSPCFGWPWTLAANVAAGSVVYDIGAHVGFFTLLCSALAGATGSVRAFEPRRENIDRLTANLRNFTITRSPAYRQSQLA
jgi:predicted methyltransferase